MVFTNSLSSYYEKFLATGEVKCIDEEIPFEIPKGWEWSKLSNVIELLSGQDFIPEKYNSSNQGIPYITGASNIVNGNLVINRWTETPTVIGKLGDLLIVCKGSGVGKMCICNVDKIHIARQIQIIRNFSNAISLSYVKSVVEANLQTIISNAQGVIPGISREHILNLLIPLPPTNEQYEIDKKLQEILPVIDRYAKSQEALDKLNVELLGNLKKSILQEAVQGRLVQQIAEEGTGEELLEQIKLEKQQLIKEGKLKKSTLTDSVIFCGDDNKYYEQVGKKCLDITEQIPFETPKNWVWTRLSHIANIYTGNSISETEKKSKFTDVIGRYYIGTKDVDFNNRIIYDNGIAIPKQYEPDFRLAPNNSILMCIEGGSAGRKIAILNQDVCFGNKLCCFSPFVGIGKYMYYYLQSPSFFELFNLNKTGIIGGVSIAKVKEILIPLPPIKEQQRIVAQIEKLFEQLR
ncbi:restriction endonuclease subunit S [Bacteroides sp.]|uniref:restriction endonuclease subunit S n=1 Tax=Bacteroides sp. TaxID=29523 RepID=UPI002A841932|nr:restriction endonuclease subunit S [Bacteroides sp.]